MNDVNARRRRREIEVINRDIEAAIASLSSVSARSGMTEARKSRAIECLSKAKTIGERILGKEANA